MKMANINVQDEVLQSTELLKAGCPMVAFDLETTGLSADSDRILSFSAKKVVEEHGTLKISDEINIFINPGFHIPEKVSEKNHIYDDDVKDCPREEEVISQIRGFLGERPFLCGYNSKSFDEKFMKALYRRTLGEDFTPFFHIDVYQMAKQKVEAEKYTLENIAHELGVDGGITFHQSMDDVTATLRVFDQLRHAFGNEEEEAAEMENLLKVKVMKLNYWSPSHELKRVYVTTAPALEGKIFYDAVRNEWKSHEKVNLADIKAQALAMTGTENEKDMVKKLEANNQFYKKTS